jgi:hypothetical protein
MDQPEHDQAPDPIDAVAETADTPALDGPAEPLEDDHDDGSPSPLEDGPVHRPLIRAQLPRIEGLKAERQAPDFTIRQNAGRGNGHFRGGGNNGQRFGRGPHRGGGGGRGGAGQGFGRGGNQQRHGGGGGPRKRGR